MSLVAAFVIALLISLLFAPGYRRGGSLVPLVIFFFVLFLAGIVAQFWITPFGPAYLGVYWFPNVFFVLLLAFVFLAPSSYNRAKQPKDSDAAAPAVVVISAFVWIVLICLLIAILIGYFNIPVKPVNNNLEEVRNYILPDISELMIGIRQLC